MNTIAELKRKRAALFAEMKTFLTEKDGDDGMSDGDKADYQAMSDRLDNHDARIGRLESLNAKDAEDADVRGREAYAWRADQGIAQGRGQGHPYGAVRHGRRFGCKVE